MSLQDGSRQKLQNFVYICWNYAEKTVASFLTDTVYNTSMQVKADSTLPSLAILWLNLSMIRDKKMASTLSLITYPSTINRWCKSSAIVVICDWLRPTFYNNKETWNGITYDSNHNVHIHNQTTVNHFMGLPTLTSGTTKDSNYGDCWRADWPVVLQRTQTMEIVEEQTSFLMLN